MSWGNTIGADVGSEIPTHDEQGGSSSDRSSDVPAQALSARGGTEQAVVLEGVEKHYHEIGAVRGISLAVERGEMFFFLGPSGSGKSTTLRLIAGLERPDAGVIRIDGRDVTHVPPHRRDTAMVFQNWALFPHKTVAANVAFGLRMRRVPRERIRAAIKSALELVRLETFENRYPRTLSGGQQQRVALARALVVQPKVLLLDEPFSNLDQRLRQEMRAEFVELQKSLRVTTIFVTHDQGEALSMGDRIAVIQNGHVAQVGTPRDLYNSPASPFVAGFVGDASRFTASVREVRPTELVVDVGGEAVCTVRPPQCPGVGDVVTVFCRPESVAVELEPSSGRSNTFAGRIKQASYLGPIVRLRIESPIGEVQADLPGQTIDSRLVDGRHDEVTVVLPPSALLVLPS